jgi:hypothetical protein
VRSGVVDIRLLGQGFRVSGFPGSNALKGADMASPELFLFIGKELVLAWNTIKFLAYLSKIKKSSGGSELGFLTIWLEVRP